MLSAKLAAAAALAAVLGVGAEKPRKLAIASSGNDDIELAATALVDPVDIRPILGAELSAGFVVVRLKATPKTENPLRISPDDFQLLSHKDGQRSGAYGPSQIAGKTALVVGATSRGGGLGVQENGPVWGGVGGRPRQLGSEPAGVGNVAGEEGRRARLESTGKENPLLKTLAEKALVDKETKETVDGLLYFLIEGKVKGKDLSLIYKGAAGRLVLEFREPK